MRNIPQQFVGFCLVILFALACKEPSSTAEVSSTDIPNKYPQNIENLFKELERNPASDSLINALIDSLGNNGFYDEAYHWSDTLIRRDSVNNLPYKLVQADVMRSAKKYEMAIEAFGEYLQQKPGDTDVQLALANTFAESGHQNTLPFIQYLWERFPTPEMKVQTLYLRGVYFNSIHDYARARKSLDSCLLRDYAFTNAYYEKGLSWFDENNFEEAVKVFRKMTEVSPKDSDGWYWLAKSQEQLGLKTEAISAYQRTLMITPNDTAAVAGIRRLSEK